MSATRKSTGSPQSRSPDPNRREASPAQIKRDGTQGSESSGGSSVEAPVEQAKARKGRKSGQSGQASTQRSSSGDRHHHHGLQRSQPLRKRLRKQISKMTKEHARRFREGDGHPFPAIRRMVMSRWFEHIVALLIIGNCVFVGFQAEMWDPSPSTAAALKLLENLFTGCFFLDLIMRVLGYGWTWLLATENYVDIFLVVQGVLVTWILGPLGVNLDIMRKLTVLRTLRLVRLARSVKSKPGFKEMWSLLKGLVDSTETLFWTYIMIFLLLYFWAIITVALISNQEGFKDDEYVQYYFGGVLSSMFTLFQIMTLDSWSGTVRPLMDTGQGWIGLFFVVFVTVSNFLLMNLITAVIVEEAMSDSRMEEQELAKRAFQKKEQELDDLRQIFKTLDLDGNAELTREELIISSKIRKVKQKLQALDIAPKDLLELWEILDGGEGSMTVEEFVTGLQRLRGEAKAKDILRVGRELRVLEGSITAINSDVAFAQGRLESVKGQLGQAKLDISSMHRTLARAREAVKQATQTQPLR